MYNTILLTIIAACSVSFIYFEYKPNFNPMSKVIEIQTPEMRPVKKPECYSKKYTEKAKREVFDCYEK